MASEAGAGAPDRTAPEVATRAAIRRRLAVWAGGSALGVAVLALPDTGPRVVSLSRDHGPSAVDAVGIVLLVAAWLPVQHLLWVRRAALRGRPARLAAGLAVVGVAALAVTIGADLGPTWVAAVAILLAAQVVLLAALWQAGA